MICVDVNSAGVVTALSVQPADMSLCRFVLSTPQESQSPFYLTIDDAELIGAQILGVWALAWAFKQIASAISIGAENED